MLILYLVFLIWSFPLGCKVWLVHRAAINDEECGHSSCCYFGQVWRKYVHGSLLCTMPPSVVGFIKTNTLMRPQQRRHVELLRGFSCNSSSGQAERPVAHFERDVVAVLSALGFIHIVEVDKGREGDYFWSNLGLQVMRSQSVYPHVCFYSPAFLNPSWSPL